MNAKITAQPLAPYKRVILWERLMSGFRDAPLQREQALRTLLDEDDDEHQDRDFGEHGARPAFEYLVEQTKAQARVDGSSQLSDPAQHDDHERVDDIRLAQVRPDVAD